MFAEKLLPTPQNYHSIVATVAQLSEELEDGLAVDVFTLTTNAVPEDDTTFHRSPSMTTLKLKNRV